MVLIAHNTEQIQRTDDIKISENVAFDTMFLAEKTLSGLRNSGFYKPSPIQLLGIPLGKCGFDILLEAKSGTGKTAVFTIIALEKIDLKQGLQTIILAPTREIAAQICDVMKQIGSCYDGLHIEVVMGGLPVVDDIKKFEKNVHVVVGSPGRLKHLIQDKHVDVSSVRLLVLDEADKLMEKAFHADVNYIFAILPRQKQVIMSSATYSDISKKFISKYVQDAQHVCPESNSVLLGVTHCVTTVKYNSNIVRLTQNRFEELLKILNTKKFKQCLIFCNYQARVSEVFKMLTKLKWPVEQLYGQQEQHLRLDALKTLQEYKCRILVSTDLAARGIDASNVDLVIHFEPPTEWPTYLHRIGRAGRFGSYGTAITILSDGKELRTFREMLGFIKYPLQLRHFWTDSLFNFDSVNSETSVFTDFANQIPVMDVNQPGECNEFWETLIGDNQVDPAEIHSFDKLYESFNEAGQIGTDSFSDLVNSFENKKCNSNEPGNFASNAIQSCNGFENGVSNDKEEPTNNFQFCKLEQDTTRSNGLRLSPGRPENHVSNVSHCNNLHTDSSNKHGIIEKEVNTFKSMSEDQYASLPTMFQSSKHSYDKQNKNIKHRNNKKKGLERNSCHNLQLHADLKTTKSNCTEDKQLGTKTKHKTPANVSISENVYRNNNSDDCNFHYNTYSQVLENNEDLKTRKRNNYLIPDNNVINSNRSTLNYDIWYNKLRAQMAQIELAIYFDEISKNCYSSRIPT